MRGREGKSIWARIACALQRNELYELARIKFIFVSFFLKQTHTRHGVYRPPFIRCSVYCFKEHLPTVTIRSKTNSELRARRNRKRNLGFKQIFVHPRVRFIKDPVVLYRRFCAAKLLVQLSFGKLILWLGDMKKIVNYIKHNIVYLYKFWLYFLFIFI